MSKQRDSNPVGRARPQNSDVPQLDRETIRELARCYARAAVDELIAAAPQPKNQKKAKSALRQV